MSLTEPSNPLGLDDSQQYGFIKYFRNLPEKPPSLVRFFNRTDYYTVHENDAVLASSFTGNIIKFMGAEPKLSYVVLSRTQFESFLRELLLISQYRVEVYIKSSGKNNDWHVEYKASPGNLSCFEEILFENSSIIFSNYVMAIGIIKDKLLAIGCVDVTESKFSVCEINDNDCFTELEALVAQKSPKECIIPEGESSDLIALKKVLERNGILVAKVKKSEFTSDDIVQNLNRLLFFHDFQSRNCLTFPETQLIRATGSLQAIINFLNLLGDEKNFNQYKFENMDYNRYVRLDNAALQALNILPASGSNMIENSVLLPNTSKSFSILGILDNCCTNQGKRLLRQWIKQPSKDINLLNERLVMVECLIREAEIRSLLCKNCLIRLPDMILLIKKISSKNASLKDCYRIYQTVASVPELISKLRRLENNTINIILVDPIQQLAAELDKFQEMIERILDMDLVERGEYLVRPDFDGDLKVVYKKKLKLEEKMQELLKDAISDLGFEEGKVKLECTEQHGYFFRVSLKTEQVLRNNKRYKVIDAIKGGVRFTNNKLVELNEEYSSLKSSYEQLQKTIVTEMFGIAVEYSESLRGLNILIATIDVLVSFANVSVSAKIPYVRPKLHVEGTGVLRLKEVRHPCLEQQDGISYIPNNVEFKKNDKTLYIITGPNMCGKSTYIRSIGVCVLMAHIGCFVPCEEAEITLVDGILARVGANDCQLKGLSTFMLEMMETSAIVKTATANSLVIIDELGRGTSTYDGCGISCAISEYLAEEVKCFSLFATHFHELIHLSQKFESVGNLHVAAVTANDTITPLYKIRDGACDKSYGIHCARMVGFPEDVLQWAVEYQKELEYYEGTKYIGDEDPSVKQKIIDEGDTIINDALEELKQKDFSKFSDKELEAEILKLRENALNKQNKFINGLLSTTN